MRKFKILSFVIISNLLLACQNDTPIQNNHSAQNNNPIQNNAPKTTITQTFDLENNIAKFTNGTWRFEKGEHLTNKWLIKLDSRAILNFARHTHNPNDLTTPTPNPNVVFLGFSSYVGCASVNGAIGLDKTQAKFYETDAGYFGNMPYCQDITDMENELAYFVGRGNIDYEFKDNHLILRDTKNQTLYFKNTIIKETDETIANIINQDWQFAYAKNLIPNSPLSNLNQKATITFFRPKKPLDKQVNSQSRYRYAISTMVNCSPMQSDVRFGNFEQDFVALSEKINFDKTTHQACDNQADNALHQFIKNNNGYYLDDEFLVLIDRQHQMLYFKKAINKP